MTEEHHDGIRECSSDVMTTDALALPLVEQSLERLCCLLKTGEGGITWRNPFAQFEYKIELADTDSSFKQEYPPKLALLLQRLTWNVLIRKGEPGRPEQYLFIPEVEAAINALPESEREAKRNQLATGYELPAHKTTGTTPAGNHPFACALLFAVRPLTWEMSESHGFYAIQIGLDFTEGDPSAWAEEDRAAFIAHLLAEIRKRAELYPDDYNRKEFVKVSGRYMDTPRHAEEQGELDEIRRWYQQTAFNRTVAMALFALTNTSTRETIMARQSATVNELENLVFWREDGTPAHGQHREDILKAMEALRVIPVPIATIEWKQLGSDRHPRWVRNKYKFGVHSILQSFWPVHEDKETGQVVYSDDFTHKKNVVRAKADRRKAIRELVAMNTMNIVDHILKKYPPDRYKLTHFEWRWNSDIAEDLICPQVSLMDDGRPRRKLKGGIHHEGSRFVNVHRRYFEVHKHLRAAGMKYALRLLDLVISEITHITKRVKGAVWIKIQAEKVIKWMNLWDDYLQRPKHVLEDHMQEAITALIAEGVLLPGTRSLPITPTNKDERKTPFYLWKVAEMWSAVALVRPEEAKEIESELQKEAASDKPSKSVQQPPTLPDIPKSNQPFLPGMEEPTAKPIPSGPEIRAAREAAGMNLREFAKQMAGPSFKTWSRIETEQRVGGTGRISEAVWDRLRAFVAKHGPKADPGSKQLFK